MTKQEERELEARHLVETLKLWINRTYKISEHNFHHASRENMLQMSVEDELVKCLTRHE